MAPKVGWKSGEGCVKIPTEVEINSINNSKENTFIYEYNSK